MAAAQNMPSHWQTSQLPKIAYGKGSISMAPAGRRSIAWVMATRR